MRKVRENGFYGRTPASGVHQCLWGSPCPALDPTSPDSSPSSPATCPSWGSSRKQIYSILLALPRLGRSSKAPELSFSSFPALFQDQPSQGPSGPHLKQPKVLHYSRTQLPSALTLEIYLLFQVNRKEKRLHPHHHSTPGYLEFQGQRGTIFKQ